MTEFTEDEIAEIRRLSQYPFHCPNCDAVFEAAVRGGAAELFCSPLCREIAKYVRYARACRQDGRDQRPDVLEALLIREAHILSGGYSTTAQARQVAPALRQQIIARDGGRCVRCGAPGTDIHHIDGDSNDSGNLQLLCSECHRQETLSHLQPVSMLPPDKQAQALALAQQLDARVSAPEPLRFCDSTAWTQAWLKIVHWRVRAFKQRGA